MTTCPGCGVVLPESDWPVDARANVSSACLELRTRVMEFEAEHLVELGNRHQLTIDAYGAQHGGPTVPAIAVTFGLIGLYLALDEGWTGTEVRDAHQFLARPARGEAGREGRMPSRPVWPVFEPPANPDWLTIADVAGASSTEEHATRVDRWVRSVWQAWSAEHDRVRAWAAAALPGEVRRRIRSG
jgi:hypothetical protein